MSKLIYKGAGQNPVECELVGEDILSYNISHGVLYAEGEKQLHFMPVDENGNSSLGNSPAIRLDKSLWNVCKVWYKEDDSSYYVFGMTQKGKQVYIQILRVDLKSYDIDIIADMRKVQEVYDMEQERNNYYGINRVANILRQEKDGTPDGTAADADFNLASNKKVRDFCVSYNSQLDRFALAFVIYGSNKASSFQLYEYTFKPDDFIDTLTSRLYRQ